MKCHAGNHDNPFGQRLTAFMISKRIVDSAVPMSLLADQPNVQFNCYRKDIGSCRWKCTERALLPCVRPPRPAEGMRLTQEHWAL